MLRRLKKIARPRNLVALVAIGFGLAFTPLAHGEQALDPYCADQLEAAKYYLSLRDRVSSERVLTELRDFNACVGNRATRRIASLQQQIELINDNPQADTLSFSPYGGYTTFGTTAAKQSLILGGIYVTSALKRGLLEVGLERLQFKLRSGAADLTQYDAAAGYTHYLSGNWNLRGAAAFEASSDTSLNTGASGTFGAVYRDGGTEAGLDSHVSFYPTAVTSSLLVAQATPYLTLRGETIGVTARGYFIYPLKGYDAYVANAVGGRTLLMSGELEVKQSFHPFYLGASAYYGDQMFALKNRGLVLINSLERYTYGGSASLGVAFSTEAYLNLLGSYQRVANASLGTSYWASGILASLSLSF